MTALSCQEKGGGTCLNMQSKHEEYEKNNGRKMKNRIDNVLHILYSERKWLDHNK